QSSFPSEIWLLCLAPSRQEGEIRVRLEWRRGSICSLQLHSSSDAKVSIFVISAASPSRAPASTHFAIVSISRSVSEISFLYRRMPTVLSRCHWRHIAHQHTLFDRARPGPVVL